MIQYPTLSIAGFDPSGGAGLQADLKTFTVFGNYGMTVVTALAVQNTMGVNSCYPIPLKAISEQLDAIFDDIPPAAIKIGMLFNEEIITLVADTLNKHPHIPVVLDPVMRAKGGDPLLLPEAEDSLRTRLLPLATVATPNLPEAWALIGEPYGSPLPPEEIGARILALGAKAVLVKGGHAEGAESTDLLLQPNAPSITFTAPRISTKNSHGTGCTLSAALAASLAQGMDLPSSTQRAKNFLTEALRSAAQKSVGSGHGPTDPTWMIPNRCHEFYT